MIWSTLEPPQTSGRTDSQSVYGTEATNVPGGCLVRTWMRDVDSQGQSVSMVFLPGVRMSGDRLVSS